MSVTSGPQRAIRMFSVWRPFILQPILKFQRRGEQANTQNLHFILSTIMIDFFSLDSLTFPAYAIKTRFGLRIMFSEIKKVKWSQKGQTWKILTFLY